MMKTRYFVTCVLAATTLMACETQDDNNIEKAQQCLNTAGQMSITSPSQAATFAQTTCQPMIANAYSNRAGSIGVGLVLIEEQKIAALTSIENAINNGSGAVTTSIAFLVFANNSNVTNLTYYAVMSGDTNAQELASIVSLAYFTNIAAGGALGPNSTAANVASYLNNMASGAQPNGPQAAAALISAQQNACSGSGSSSTLCADLTKAVGPNPNPNNWSSILSSAATYVQNGG